MIAIMSALLCIAVLLSILLIQGKYPIWLKLLMTTLVVVVSFWVHRSYNELAGLPMPDQVPDVVQYLEHVKTGDNIYIWVMERGSPPRSYSIPNTPGNNAITQEARKRKSKGKGKPVMLKGGKLETEGKKGKSGGSGKEKKSGSGKEAKGKSKGGFKIKAAEAFWDLKDVKMGEKR